MEVIFDKTENLKKFRDEIFEAITYWDDVKLISDISEQDSLNDTGEIFFEAQGGYLLKALE